MKPTHKQRITKALIARHLKALKAAGIVVQYGYGSKATFALARKTGGRA